MTTAAIYIRVSTEDQTDYSPDAQKRLLYSYADQHNYVIPDEYIFIDEGISGRRADKRPAFMKMIKEAKKNPKPFDTILVHKFDRFSRSREDSILYKSLLKRECGIRVISITEHLEDDKFSIILEAILEAMAEYYSLNLSDEVLKGMTEKAIHGGYQAAPPLGYTIKHQKAIPSILESEALIVRKIYTDYLTYHHSPYEIAKDLNRLSYVTKRGNLFEKRTVEYILKNPFYAGYIRFQLRNDPNKQIFTKGIHTPIISESIYQQVQSTYQIKENQFKKHDPYTKHWLSGIVKCGNCGSSLLVFKRVLAKSQATYYNLQCCGYQKGKCLQSHQLSERKMLSTTISSLLEVYPQDSNIYHQVIPFIKDKTVENTIYDENLHRLELRLKRLKEAYLNGIETLDEYAQNKQMIQSQITALLKDQKHINHVNTQTDLTTSYPTLASLLESDTISNSEKHIILTTLIHHIVYDKTSETLRFYYNTPNNIPNCDCTPTYNKADPMGL